MEKLYIRFHPLQIAWDTLSEAIVYWCLTDHRGQHTDNNGRLSLSSIAELAKDREVIVFLPVGDVMVRKVHLKARKYSQAMKAIPFLLEEDLAEDVDGLQFALSERNSNDEYTIAVISKEKLDLLLATLKEIGIRPSIVTVDCFGLPYLPDQWLACVQDGQVLVRTGLWSGFSCHSKEFAAFSKLYVTSEGTSPELVNLAFHPDSDLSSIRESELLIEETSNWTPDIYYQGFDENVCINLLQGRYATETRRSADLKPWKVAAVLAAVCLLAWAASQGLDVWKLKQQNKKLDAAIEIALSRYFPEISDPDQARSLIKQKLKIASELGSSEHSRQFIKTLATTASSMRQQSGISVQQIQYRSERLELSLKVPDIQQLERLKQALDRNQLQAEVKSATADGSMTNAQLSVWSKS